MSRVGELEDVRLLIPPGCILAMLEEREVQPHDVPTEVDEEQIGLVRLRRLNPGQSSSCPNTFLLMPRFPIVLPSLLCSLCTTAARIRHVITASCLHGVRKHSVDAAPHGQVCHQRP